MCPQPYKFATRIPCEPRISLICLRTHFAALVLVEFSALKTENRSDNRYTEVVSDPDTWEIVHEVGDRRTPRLLSPRLPSSRQTKEKNRARCIFRWILGHYICVTPRGGDGIA